MSFIQEMSTQDLLATIAKFREGIRETDDSYIHDMLETAIRDMNEELADRADRVHNDECRCNSCDTEYAIALAEQMGDC